MAVTNPSVPVGVDPVEQPSSTDLVHLPDQTLADELAHLREEWHWLQHRDQANPERSAESPSIQSRLAQLESQIADRWRRLYVNQHNANQHDADQYVDSRQFKEVTVCSGVGFDRLSPRGSRRLLKESTQWATVREDVEQYAADALQMRQIVQSTLVQGQALLQFFAVEESLYLLIITPADAIRIPLGDRAALVRAMAAWRHHLRDGALISDPSQVGLVVAQRLLLALHRALVEPALPLLDQCEKLFVVLPAAWHDVPLAALYDGRAYLLQHYQVTHLSSAAALFSRHEPAESMPGRGASADCRPYIERRATPQSTGSRSRGAKPARCRTSGGHASDRQSRHSRFSADHRS